jgi:hypothetical protein
VACDRRLLWRFGISGDRPLILVSAGSDPGPGPAALAGAGAAPVGLGRRGLRPGGGERRAASYQMPLQRELAALRDRHAADSAALRRRRAASTGLHLLRAEELSADELSTLQTLARVRLLADGRPLLHHVQAWSALHERPSARQAARPRPHRWPPRGTPPTVAPKAASMPTPASSASRSGAAMRPRGPGSTCWRTGLRRPGPKPAAATPGPQQPAEPAHRVVERPRGRPAGGVVPAAGPPHPRRSGAWRLRPGAARGGLPRGARPGLHHHRPPPRRPGGHGDLVRGRPDLRQAGAPAPRQPRPPPRCSCASSASPSG